MNTQNNEWRDLLPDERVQEGDEAFDDLSSKWILVSHHRWGTIYDQASGWQFRTRRPLPTATTGYFQVVPDSFVPAGQHAKGCEEGKPCVAGCAAHLPAPDVKDSLTTDPIARAIQQMEEAARVLLEEKDDYIECYRCDGGEIRWKGCTSSGTHCDTTALAEALGYTSHDQQRYLKLKEAERLTSESMRLIAEANKLGAEAMKLREEATNK